MASDKRGFDNAAMTGEQPPPSYNYPSAYSQPTAGYGQTQYGYNQPQGYGQPVQQGYGQPIQHGAPGYPPVVVTVGAAAMQEPGPRPDTSTSLIVSILSLIFCLGAWPFAVVAIIFNRKANSQANLGQFTAARSALKTTYIFVGVTVVLGILAWVIFAVRLKYTLDYVKEHEDDWKY